MTVSELLRELENHYLDGDCQVTVDRDPTKWSTGNGLLHTGFAGIVLARLGVSKELLGWVGKAFEMAEDPGQPGVFDRNAGRNDKNAHDDAYGIVGASSVLGLRFHKDILKHGLTHFFIYENVDGIFNGLKDAWALRLRFPFVILWYFLASDWLRPLAGLMRFYLRRYVDKSHPSGLIKAYCVIGSMAVKNKAWAAFEKEWLEANDLVGAVKEYFYKKDQPEHPIVGLVRAHVSSVTFTADFL